MSLQFKALNFAMTNGAHVVACVQNKLDFFVVQSFYCFFDEGQVVVCV